MNIKKFTAAAMSLVMMCGTAMNAPYIPQLKPAAASAADGAEYLTFKAVSGGYEVTESDIYTYGDVVIPSTYNGSPVVSIGDSAFLGRNYLTSVTIPDSVKTIGKNAFKDCKSLKSVSLGKGLVTLSSYAFKGCKALETVNLPENLQTIGAEVFSNCSSINTLSTLQIPSKVKSVGMYAFLGVSCINKVYLPQSVATIGTGAFASLPNLQMIEIANPECNIYDQENTICNAYTYSNGRITSSSFSGTICGATGSTAQSYAAARNSGYNDLDHKENNYYHNHQTYNNDNHNYCKAYNNYYQNDHFNFQTHHNLFHSQTH